MQLCHISIHLMLLFIGIADVIRIRWTIFQYISCYCLSATISSIPLKYCISIHLMLLFIASGRKQCQLYMYHFNTSHVTVYPLTRLSIPYLP